MILPQQLRKAREALALSREEVASRLAISIGALTAWEDGLEQPPLERLWELSELYRRDVDYFLLPHEGLPAALSFRVTRRHRLQELSLETRQVIAAFDELCRSAREIESVLELPQPEPWPTPPRETSGEELARVERLRLRIGDKPIVDVRRLIESLGILCFHLPIPNDEFSGLAWDHPEYGPCILINGGENPGRRAFTTSHEYAHLLRRDGDSVCDLQIDNGVEREANRFATEFLMPAPDVRESFHRRGLSGSIPSLDGLAGLARRYSVSLEAMSHRLEELQLVPPGTSRSLDFTSPPSKYFGRAKPRWRRRVGETVTSNALEAYGSGRISIGKLAHYLGIDIRQAMDLAEKDRETPSPDRA